MSYGKDLKERLITLDEFHKLEENRKRRFRISYTKWNTIIRTERIFQQKRYIYDILDDPLVEKVKLYVGDVIETS